MVPFLLRVSPELVGSSHSDGGRGGGVWGQQKEADGPEKVTDSLGPVEQLASKICGGGADGLAAACPRERERDRPGGWTPSARPGQLRGEGAEGEACARKGPLGEHRKFHLGMLLRRAKGDAGF